MHIPTHTTGEIEVLSFEKALVLSKEKNDIYDVDEWIYVPPFYDEYRYILGTIGKNPLICIGINPSTAVPNNLDNTLKSVQRIAKNNGHDSFIMFNVYAQRATNPDDMEKDFNSELHRENIKAFEYILSRCEQSPCIWAAWGAIIEKRDYLPALINDFVKASEKFGAKWFSVGQISKKGHPHHPLYLRADLKKELFDVNSYLDCVGK